MKNQDAKEAIQEAQFISNEHSIRIKLLDEIKVAQDAKRVNRGNHCWHAMLSQEIKLKKQLTR
ncbi:MAG: hypothetical protein GY928_14570 [Colwellia sp.]|nr:hypothetical protein [Colwellia sp.]